MEAAAAGQWQVRFTDSMTTRSHIQTEMSRLPMCHSGSSDGIFSGLSLDFLRSAPPPETAEERAARIAAEEAEVPHPPPVCARARVCVCVCVCVCVRVRVALPPPPSLPHVPIHTDKPSWRTES